MKDPISDFLRGTIAAKFNQPRNPLESAAWLEGYDERKKWGDAVAKWLKPNEPKQ